jgi:hypothetical protein
MFRAMLLVACVAVGQSFSDPGKLDAVRATATSMRGTQMQNIQKGAPRGATPQLSIAKHQLRDWIESRLPELRQQDSPEAFEEHLNSDLRAAALMFDESHASASDPWSIEYLGYVNPVRVQRRSAFIVVVTSLGIQCGEDDSAYVYGVDFSDPPTPIGDPPKRVYFTVRWRPPYQFSIVRVSDVPSAACNQQDREADDSPQTLFR